MAYTKFHSAANDPQTDTPITAAGLDWIEAGIESAAATADQAHTEVAAVSAGVVAESAQVVTNTSDIAAISAHTAVPSVIPALLRPVQQQRLLDGNYAAGLGAGPLGVPQGRGRCHLRPGACPGPGWQTPTCDSSSPRTPRPEGSRRGFGYTPVANTETMSFTAWGAVDSSQDITVPATAYLRKDVTFALTGLAGADLIAFYIKHEGAHANDTLAVNTWLFGAWLEPT